MSLFVCAKGAPNSAVEEVSRLTVVDGGMVEARLLIAATLRMRGFRFAEVHEDEDGDAPIHPPITSRKTE